MNVFVEKNFTQFALRERERNSMVSVWYSHAMSDEVWGQRVEWPPIKMTALHMHRLKWQ